MDREKIAIGLNLILTFLFLGGKSSHTHHVRTARDNPTPRSFRPERGGMKHRPTTKSHQRPR